MVRKTFASIKNLLTREQNEVLSAAAILMAIGIVTKVLGMLATTIAAREFGASQDMENFKLAAILPDTITGILLIGAISGSIIPIFTKANQTQDEKSFTKSYSNVMNIIMLLFGVIGIFAIIFSRQLVPAAQSISQSTRFFSEADTNTVVWMLRIMLIPQVLLLFSAFFSTWLNIKQRFIIPQLAPLFYNVGRIFGALVIVPLVAGSIWGLVWGSVIGAVLHILIQIPLLRHLNFKWTIFQLDFKDRNFINAAKFGLPRMVSLAMEQLAGLVDGMIALSLGFSSLSILSQYANPIIGFPLSLGVSFAIASFPSFSKLKAMEKHDEFSKLFLKVVNQVIYLTLPIAVILIVLRVPAIRLTFGILGGEFDWNTTLRVAWVVTFFSFGIMFEALRSIIFRVYFAINNSVVPFVSSLFVLVMGVFTGITFSNYFTHIVPFSISNLTFNIDYFFTRGPGDYGVVGLALSSSVVFSLEFFMLLFVLWKMKVVFGVKAFLKKLVIKFVIATVMLIVCYILAKFWENILNTSKTLQLFILTATTAFASFSIYLLLSYMFAVEEVRIFIKLLNKILKVFKINIEE